MDLKNWQIWRIGRNGNDGRVRNDEINFEILKKWHHTWENGYHWKLRKFRQFQKIKIQGNHAYEKLDSNGKEHSKIKDLEFHSRSKMQKFLFLQFQKILDLFLRPHPRVSCLKIKKFPKPLLALRAKAFQPSLAWLAFQLIIH